MSNIPAYNGPSFKDIELSSWERKADKYDGLLGQVTNPSIGPLLDAAGVGESSKVLDIACGPGYGAGGAAARGADAIGLDMAPNMVAEASKNFPAAEFQVGEGESLPFDDERFDAVVTSFGILHMTDLDKAISEAYRVLKPGGRYAFSTWQTANKHPFMALINNSIKIHGDPNVPLPPSPDHTIFADPDKSRDILEGVGFTSVTMTDLDLSWQTDTAASFLDMIHDSLVRSSFVFVHQTEEAQSRIEAAIVEGAENYKTADGYKIAWPAVLISAEKA